MSVSPASGKKARHNLTRSVKEGERKLFEPLSAQEDDTQMTEHELSNQELNRHEEKIGQNVKRNQALNLEQKTRRIAADNQNSAVTRLVQIVYYLFS